MATGDVYAVGVTAVPANGFLNLQPTVGEEIVVHNISFSESVELQYYDGINYVVTEESSVGGSLVGMYLHCTNAKYYRIKNTAAVDNYIAADGMKTK